MTVWRIKLNSQHDDVIGKWDAARAHCREKEIVGVGWGRPEVLADGATLEEVIAAVEAKDEPGWVPAGPRVIRRLAEQMQDGDLIWTRDTSGSYWLGKITGPWRYENSEDASRWDLANVRPCLWLATSFRDYEVPGAVVRNFSGRGGTLSRIHDAAANRISEMLWNRGSDPNAPWPRVTPAEALAGLLDPTDVEDVVLIWLQASGWILMPSTRLNSTPVYEAALRRQDGSIAVVSVKSGTSATVPVPELAAAAGGTAQAYAYSTAGLYSQTPEDHGVIRIESGQLIEFMASHPKLLPPRISRWLTGELPPSL